ncbi:MAG: cytochrome b [Gammaproteobacteria bacterium]
MSTLVPLRNTRERYGLIAQLFHWVIVVLVIAQFALGFTAHGLPISLERLILLARHKSIGITIFVLVVLRLVWRFYSKPPALPPSPHRFFDTAAHLSHGLLYALLLAMPPVGWLLSSASHLTVAWFGWFSLPNLVGPDKRLAHGLLLTHESMAWLLLATITVHVLAALWHHFLLKDSVLLRMLPFTRRAPRKQEST